MLEPALPAYLSIPYVSKPGQRGGTLIAEGVWDLEAHHRRLSSPDGYRPEWCPRCHGGLEGHGLRWRKLRDQPESAGAEIRRYRCPECRAVWQVLPAFIARHLQRSWGAIQSRLVAAGVLEGTGAEWRVRSKPTTLMRWLQRLLSNAVVLTQALVDGGGEVATVVQGLGSWCNRLELIEGLSQAQVLSSHRKVGELACFIQRLVPGVRVM